MSQTSQRQTQGASAMGGTRTLYELMKRGRVQNQGTLVVAYYRIYFRDALTARIDGLETIDAESDDQAIGVMRNLLTAGALELWCLDRRVLRLEPADPGPRRIADVYLRPLVTMVDDQSIGDAFETLLEAIDKADRASD